MSEHSDKSEGSLRFRLEMPGRLPSLNQLFSMNHWQRKKYKDQLAKDFLCALQAAAADCSTKTTSSPSITQIYAETLARYLAMRRAKRESKRASKRSGRKNRRKF